MQAIYQSLIDDIDDPSLVLAILHAMREESMRRLLESCIEMDPAQREGMIALIRGLQTSSAVPVQSETIPEDELPRAASL